MIAAFFSGIGVLGRGFGFWARRPRLMLLGVVPAAIVGAVMLAALIALGVQLPGIVDWATPFADGWVPFWAGALRILIGVATFGAAALLAAVTFTALTLVVGDPFYERIWAAVERELGDAPDGGPGFWRAVADGAALVGLGILAAVVAALAGAIPFLGVVAGPVLGVGLSGWLLARELMGRAFDARGIGADERRMLLRGRRARVLGFGVAVQLCFMVPLGPVVAMPAAVAGATMLARGLLDARATSGDAAPPASGA